LQRFLTHFLLFRKFADAQKEMQSLRTRLTLAETKLVEKEVELATLKEENSVLKESLEKIGQQQQQFGSKFLFLFWSTADGRVDVYRNVVLHYFV
jgi:predicted nuclease with TOPRIM domain